MLGQKQMHVPHQKAVNYMQASGYKIYDISTIIEKQFKRIYWKDSSRIPNQSVADQIFSLTKIQINLLTYNKVEWK